MKAKIDFQIKKTFNKAVFEFTEKELEMLYALTGAFVGSGELRTFTENLFAEIKPYFSDDCHYKLCNDLKIKYGIKGNISLKGLPV